MIEGKGGEKLKAIREKIYTLKLNEKEAMWLKAVMQNPLYSLEPDEEREDNKEMRKRFFETLRNIGVP